MLEAEVVAQTVRPRAGIFQFAIWSAAAAASDGETGQVASFQVFQVSAKEEEWKVGDVQRDMDTHPLSLSPVLAKAS